MTTKGSVAGSSLSYAVAQNIAQQDLFGGHCDEEFFFAEPKSRIPLERLHKTTIKEEMNEDSKKKKKKLNFSHNDYLIYNCSCTSDSETYSLVHTQ